MVEASDNLPFITAAIVPPTEKAPVPTVITGKGTEAGIGAVSVAAQIADRDNAPVVVEGLRRDLFMRPDATAQTTQLIEGIPTQISTDQPNQFGTKQTTDPTSLANRLSGRPTAVKETVEIPLGRRLFDKRWTIYSRTLSPNPRTFPKIPIGDERRPRQP